MGTRLEKLALWHGFSKVPRIVRRPVIGFLCFLIRRFDWTEAQRVEHALDELSMKHPRLIEIAERIKIKQVHARALPEGSFESWSASEGISFLIDKYERMRRELFIALAERRGVVDPDYVPVAPRLNPGPVTAEELRNSPECLPDPPGSGTGSGVSRSR